MSTSYIGIQNENEFYSHHYLSEVFAGDIKETTSRWRESQTDDSEKQDSPDQSLRKLSRPYRQFRQNFRLERRHKERVELQREWFRQILVALGYEFKPHNHALDNGSKDEIPALCAVGGQGGPAHLLVLGAFDPTGEDEDPLSLRPHPAQFHGETPPAQELLKETWEQVITRRVFGQDHPPRWVLLLAPGQVLLIERGKWAHNRLLRFVFDEIFGRNEAPTLQATAALLHRESLAPQDGLCLLDSLDENSHKHAFAVSKDLKYALRESIELIGNEAIHYLREVRKERIYQLDEKLAGELGLEALRYMYRLLFLFYIEARPELGYAPLKSEAYRKGYSLEHLRELELVRLDSEESRNGYYLHHSIQTLFRLISEGFDGGEQGLFQTNAFQINKLDSALFRGRATPLLDGVKLRNKVLQRVLELMSLTRPAKGRRGRRGRISYSQLGINQLGSVYEALLSYRGFFAEEELYEVKRPGQEPDELDHAWFVPASEISRYRENERVYTRDENRNRRLKTHPRGKFIYRLAGRDREKSASYYTPESLTRCVVKYALKELITDDMPARDMLDLTICEPAMGSAAFLTEAVNQLAEKYLERRQRERGMRIPHAEFADELQKVKHFIADRNVYGVDLNPVAGELGEISLWLNCIYKDSRVPWFGYQLVCGNSLVGARRQVYATSSITKQPKEGLWFNHAPVRVEPSQFVDVGKKGAASQAEGTAGLKRPENTVYHFLLPDPGMANYKNKAAKALEPEKFKEIADWRREFCKPLSEQEASALEKLSDRIDDLWSLHSEQLARDHRETEDSLPVWGQKGAAKPRLTSNEWKDRIRKQGIFSESDNTASPFRRLKLVKDYWCALWFWPIDKAHLLPSRKKFLDEISLVLTGTVTRHEIDQGGIADLFGEEYAAR